MMISPVEPALKPAPVSEADRWLYALVDRSGLIVLLRDGALAGWNTPIFGLGTKISLGAAKENDLLWGAAYVCGCSPRKPLKDEISSVEG